MSERRLSAWLLIPLFLLSGAASLVYEVIWSRLLVHVMGGTTFAITTVLVAFMGGLALGAAIAGRLAGRAGQPQRVYGVLEILIGIYGLATPWLMGLAVPLYRVLYEYSGQSFGLLLVARFVVSCTFLLVPTTMMGATLPLLVQYMAVGRGRVGSSVAVLYAVNTFGAVLGSASAGFLAIPLLGLTRATMTAAALNFFVGVFVWVLPRHFPAARADAMAEAGGRRRPAEAPAPELDTTTGWGRQLIFWTFALSGACAMLYQVCWVRALIMSVGPHTYGFTIILVAFIFGIGVGSLAVARWVDRWRSPVLAYGLMELGIAASALIGVYFFGRMPVYVLDAVQAKRNALGELPPGAFQSLLWFQFLVVLALLFVPTFLMGAIFPLINRLCARRADDSGHTVGVAYAVNTLGTIAGTTVAGFVLIPASSVGVRRTILIGVVVSAVIGLVLVAASARRARGAAHLGAFAAGAACVAGIFFVPAWDRMLLSSAAYWGRSVDLSVEKLLYYREGVDATVAVTEIHGSDPTAAELVQRLLRINGKVDASNSLLDGFTHVGFPHLAIMSAPRVERMLIVGLGSGISVGAAAVHPEVERIDCAEISDAVVEAARLGFDDYDYRALDDPRVRMIRADGRNHLLLTGERYDVILSIPSNPWMAGVSNLFTREYFALCRDRLTENGRLCIWLQSYSITMEDFKVVIRTLAGVFPHITMWQGGPDDLMLIAAVKPYRLDAGRVIGCFEQPAVRADLARIGFAAPHVLASTLVSGGAKLVEWAGDGIHNTDDNAHLEYSAPLALYASERETDTIMTSLLEQAALPVEAAVEIDDSNEQHRALLESAARGQAALRLRYRAFHESWTGQYAAAIESMFKSVVDYPEHPLASCELRTQFLPQVMKLARLPEQEALRSALRPILPVVRNLALPSPVLGRTEPLQR